MNYCKKAFTDGKTDGLPWIKQLSIFLQNYGIGTMEAQMSNLKENYIKSKIKHRLQDQHIQKYDSYIKANIETGQTCVLENCHDINYRKRHYLTAVQSPDIRTIFTRLRIDSNKLADSKLRSFRYKSQLDDNCSDCQVQESVTHRLLYCTKGGLDKIRESFYKAMNEVVKNFSLFENCKKINFILNVASDTNDFVRAKVVSYLCKFVKDMYKPD